MVVEERRLLLFREREGTAWVLKIDEVCFSVVNFIKIKNS